VNFEHYLTCTYFCRVGHWIVVQSVR